MLEYNPWSASGLSAAVLGKPVLQVVTIMNLAVYKKLRDNINRRNEIHFPRATLIITSIAAFTLVLVIVSILGVPARKSLDYHFINERGLISFSTQFFLMIAGAFSLATLIAQLEHNDSHHLLWGLLALGFFILAADEFFHLDSIAGRILQHQFSWIRYHWWKDLLVILYGVIAVVVLVIYLPEIFRYPLVFELFCLGFAFYFLQTFLDVTRNQTVFDNIIEETFKIFSVAFLAQATLFSYLGALHKTGNTDTKSG